MTRDNGNVNDALATTLFLYGYYSTNYNIIVNDVVFY